MPLDRVSIVAPLIHKLPTRGYGAIEKIVLERARAFADLGIRVQLVGNTDDAGLADAILRIDKLYKLPTSIAQHLAWIAGLEWTRYVFTYLRARDQLWDGPLVADVSAIDPPNNFVLGCILDYSRSLFVLHGNTFLTNGKMRPAFEPFRFLSKKLRFGALNTRTADILRRQGFRAHYFPNGTFFPPPINVETNPEPYLLFIGLMNRDKSPHTAVRIALNSHMPLKLVGPIGDPFYFDQMIRPRLGGGVEYLGEVPTPVRDKLLRRALALVFTSAWNDPQPTVILEALSMGVPILAVPPGFYSGFFDMVTDGENGVIDSPDALPGRMGEIRSLSRLGIYETARARWEWGNVIRAYHLPVLQSLGD